MIRKLALMALILTGVTATSPTDARGGTYDVHVCRGSDGTVFGTTGWEALNPSPGMSYDLGCEDGSFGVATGPISSPLPANFRTGWQFNLSKPLTIASIDADYVGQVTPFSGGSAQIWAHHYGEPGWLDVSSCEGEDCVVSFKDQPMYGMGAIAFGIRCGPSQACAAGSYADMELNYLKLRINDPQVPQINSAVTSLASGVPVAGPTSVTFSARDLESGIRSATLEIDGKAVATRVFDTDAHTCHEPFVRLNPCPSAVSGSLAGDTTMLSDGRHSARVLVSDATGTNAGIAGPWTFTTANRLVRNLCSAPMGASARVRLKPRSVRFGRGAALHVRWPTVPWTSAEVALLTGKSRLAISRPVTLSASGRSVLDVPSGHNRLVRVGIRPAGSTGPFACSKPLAVRVTAGVTLRVHPRLLDNGHTVRLRGRLFGGRRARGRSVVVEARAKGGRRRWTPVTVLHARKGGRFHFRYRFARTYQTTRYFFRARVPRQRGFPYVSGHSARVPVLVEP